MKKYKLTTKQRIYLIFLFPIWCITSLTNPDAKSWHEVKSGMEAHKHNYTLMKRKGSRIIFICDHPGCNSTHED